MRTVTFQSFSPSEKMPEPYMYLVFKTTQKTEEYMGFYSALKERFVSTYGDKWTDIDDVTEWRYMTEDAEKQLNSTESSKGQIL